MMDGTTLSWDQLVAYARTIGWAKPQRHKPFPRRPLNAREKERLVPNSS